MLTTKNAPLRLKASVSEDGTFEGYASVFGVVDQVGDIVVKGAYAATIAAHKAAGTQPKMLWQHDDRQPIGVWTQMREDDYGLIVKGKFTRGVRAAEEARALMLDGAIDGLSIGFETTDYEMAKAVEVAAKLGIESEIVAPAHANGMVRLVKGIDLWEISAVTFPACRPARIDPSSVKTAAQARASLAELARAVARRQQAIARLITA